MPSFISIDLSNLIFLELEIINELVSRFVFIDVQLQWRILDYLWFIKNFDPFRVRLSWSYKSFLCFRIFWWRLFTSKLLWWWCKILFNNSPINSLDLARTFSIRKPYWWYLLVNNVWCVHCILHSILFSTGKI
jgi:hypothetical protein